MLCFPEYCFLFLFILICHSLHSIYKCPLQDCCFCSFLLSRGVRATIEKRCLRHNCLSISHNVPKSWQQQVIKYKASFVKNFYWEMPLITYNFFLSNRASTLSIPGNFFPLFVIQQINKKQQKEPNCAFQLQCFPFHLPRFSYIQYWIGCRWVQSGWQWHRG